MISVLHNLPGMRQWFSKWTNMSALNSSNYTVHFFFRTKKKSGCFSLCSRITAELKMQVRYLQICLGAVRYPLHYLCPQCIIYISEFLLFPETFSWTVLILWGRIYLGFTAVIQALLHRPPACLAGTPNVSCFSTCSGWVPHIARLFAHTVWSQSTPMLQLSQIQPCIWIRAVPPDSLHSSAWDELIHTVNSLFSSQLGLIIFLSRWWDSCTHICLNSNDEMHLFVIHSAAYHHIWRGCTRPRIQRFSLLTIH